MACALVAVVLWVRGVPLQNVIVVFWPVKWIDFDKLTILEPNKTETQIIKKKNLN